jgi:tRNA(adenine34) deaminase
MDFSDRDRHFMMEALKEAKAAFQQDEVPVGAIVVSGDRIIARGRNQVEQLHDSTAHAEILAMTAAFHFLGSKYLTGTTIYITLEPCLMCAGALGLSRPARIVYGARDEKNGYLRMTGKKSPFHPRTLVQHGLFEEESLSLMRGFFGTKRKGKFI